MPPKQRKFIEVVLRFSLDLEAQIAAAKKRDLGGIADTELSR